MRYILDVNTLEDELILLCCRLLDGNTIEHVNVTDDLDKKSDVRMLARKGGHTFSPKKFRISSFAPLSWMIALMGK